MIYIVMRIVKEHDTKEFWPGSPASSLVCSRAVDLSFVSEIWLWSKKGNTKVLNIEIYKERNGALEQ